MRNYLVLGQYNALCDRCGFKFKNVDLRKEWTGLMVCDKCWEPRHPQDLIRVPKDTPATPWSRPEPADTFTTGPDYQPTISSFTDGSPYPQYVRFAVFCVPSSLLKSSLFTSIIWYRSGVPVLTTRVLQLGEEIEIPISEGTVPVYATLMSDSTVMGTTNTITFNFTSPP